MVAKPKPYLSDILQAVNDHSSRIRAALFESRKIEPGDILALEKASIKELRDKFEYWGFADKIDWED